MSNLTFLYQYLKETNRIIDKEEFKFQLNSHPDYPSILAIVDTLNFFNISSNAFNIAPENYNLLPNNFIAYIKEENDSYLPYFFKKDNNTYTYKIDKEKFYLNENEFINRSTQIFLLIEENISKDSKLKTNNVILPLLKLVLIILFFFLIFNAKGTYYTYVFILSSLIGLLFSISSLNELLGINNESLNKFCKISKTSDCSSIINSKKWTLFSYLNFSDISIVFFSSQILSFIFLNQNQFDFLSIQKILLLASVPFIFLSIYFQGYIERKWCPICLSISLIIIFQLFYTYILFDNKINANLASINIFSITFITVYLVLYYSKKIIISNNHLKNNLIRLNRIVKDYNYFKNNLLKEPKINLPLYSLNVGNKNTNKQICILTSPFCGYCEEAHHVIDEMYSKYKDKLSINFILYVDVSSFEHKTNHKLFYLKLVSLNLNYDDTKFLEALDIWFKIKNIEQWLILYDFVEIDSKSYDILKSYDIWCINNDLHFTPLLLVNNYKLPSKYDFKDILYFIEDYIQDKEI